MNWIFKSLCSFLDFHDEGKRDLVKSVIIDISISILEEALKDIFDAILPNKPINTAISTIVNLRIIEDHG